MPTMKDETKLHIKDFFTSGLDANTDVEVKRKVILMNVICVIGVLNFVPHGISALFYDNITNVNLQYAQRFLLYGNLFYKMG